MTCLGLFSWSSCRTCLSGVRCLVRVQMCSFLWFHIIDGDGICAYTMPDCEVFVVLVENFNERGCELSFDVSFPTTTQKQTCREGETFRILVWCTI